MKYFGSGKLFIGLILMSLLACTSHRARTILLFDNHWKFHLGDVPQAKEMDFNDTSWRSLTLPHDWSIEGAFSDTNPATPSGGALPGGIGWYRKTFMLPEAMKGKEVFIDFDGVYRNSEVWVNNHYLGIRPYGYASFRYNLTPFLNYGTVKNVLAVKIDNSKQPNSRWYSGSGIFRNVWLTETGKAYISHWGTFVTTTEVSAASASVRIESIIRNRMPEHGKIKLQTQLVSPEGKVITTISSEEECMPDTSIKIIQKLVVNRPELWSVETPRIYHAKTKVWFNGKHTDDYITPFGIRYFTFDRYKGFLLNGKHVKIVGVCDHHDLGCLGAAVNTRATQRQLEILKNMGINGIRTSHNPPAPELLDLCDRMGFIVMDEAFDMWKKAKTPYDYHLDWDQWHRKDLSDMIRRDRNHPSVFIWSIGNEIPEQNDTSGITIARELAGIVRSLDTTRPITSALNEPFVWNNIIKSGALDLIGFNYHHDLFSQFLKTFPGQKFIATETTSAFATRGSYDMPSDSIRRWPVRWDLPLTTGNADYTCSSYDNCSAPWGSTHEETWRVIKKYDFLSGMFIWTGFDYLGEPTPYTWPARSSYFGIVDLAGFPKDVYYMYQSELTKKTVLHIFPYWNWPLGKVVDVWAYTNCDSVNLFLNGISLGMKHKTGDQLHLMWRVKFVPGMLRAIGYKKGKMVMTREIKTAGKPARIVLSADRDSIHANGRDLSFVTVKVTDKDGTLVPHADNLIHFDIQGNGFIAGVDNGNQISHEPFKASYRKAFNGLCLVVVQSSGTHGRIHLKAHSSGLTSANLTLLAD